MLLLLKFKNPLKLKKKAQKVFRSSEQTTV